MQGKRSVDRRLRRSLDEGSGTIIAFVVGLAVFMVYVSILASFTIVPATTARPSSAIARAQAQDILRVFTESPGIPANWAASPSSVDAVKRPGLLLDGTLRTVDMKKFGTLWRGPYTGSAPSGKLDYRDVQGTLGIGDRVTGWHFHLRGTPLFPPGLFGTAGMGNYRVAYIGHYSGSTEQASSVSEAQDIDELGVAFDNVRRTSTVSGDKYADNNGANSDARALLQPRLNLTLADAYAVSGSLPANLFTRFSEDQLTSIGYPSPFEGSYAIAIGKFTPAVDVSYERGKDFRVVIGHADLAGLAWPPRASWMELVDGEGTNRTFPTTDTADDYGVLEVSTNGGSSWTELNPLAESGTFAGRQPSISTQPGSASPLAGGGKPTTWTRHTVDFGACGACAGAQDVMLALRWRSDNDANVGNGWLVDSFEVADALGGVGFRTGFDYPYYSVVVVGSNVDQNAMAPSSVKYALRDFVAGGGDLVVLGGQNDVNWLQPIFSAGINTGQSTEPRAQDPTATFLTTPNTLNYQAWDAQDSAWNVGATGFDNVVHGDNPVSDYVIGVSQEGLLGSLSGHVVLSSYFPYTMTPTDAKSFLANAFAYGRFSNLYLDFGPPIPTRTAVESAQSTLIVDRSRTGAGDLTEELTTLYVWR